MGWSKDREARQGLAGCIPPLLLSPHSWPQKFLFQRDCLASVRFPSFGAQLGVRSGSDHPCLAHVTNFGRSKLGELWQEKGQDRDTGPSVGTRTSRGAGAVFCHRVSPSVSGRPWKSVALPPFLFLLLTFSLQRRSSSLIFAEPWLADLSLSLCLCLCLSLYVL